jgi:hypothetical protein
VIGLVVTYLFKHPINSTSLNVCLYALFSSPNIIRVSKSRIIKWAGHVARVEERYINNFSGEDLGVDGRIILKCIFEKWVGRSWTGSIWLRIGTSGGLL